ncbi:hypothetical protein BD626DRAFT_435832 [Schizophyllum amplum]|uniref:DUF1996 domain-containing protein n=1 Tax=Schizophyllum amplum TaxID=97359 RepID=A0A550C6P5_9AGAR|nr:hypothetical protein BD626DRAFT_435832 [Auriculariopsis ampla]
MPRLAHSALLVTALSALAPSASAFFLQGLDFIVTERADPVVEPGVQSAHVHSVIGGSNFDLITNTSYLQQSECTSAQIKQDKSNYWFPHMYFQWANGSFTSLTGGAVTYYLFGDEAGSATAFPDDFRMVSGDPMLRTYNASSKAQQAVSFNCLDFEGTSVTYPWMPTVNCPSGIRAQINFPMCWDGVNTDSDDHKSHVAFPSGGADSGTCNDPAFPVTLPRIFIEVYWGTGDWSDKWGQAMNTSQPFVFANGDPTGWGYHADFINGWEDGALQSLMDKCGACTSQAYGGIDCCYDMGVVTKNEDANNCSIDPVFDEQVTGTLAALPGNNPVTYTSGAAMVPAAGVSSAASSEAATSTSASAEPASSAPAGNVNLATPHHAHHHQRLTHARRGSF